MVKKICIPKINIEDYTYELPSECIAQYPLAEREESKLLCSFGGTIREDSFRNIAGYIPSGSLMVFNDTRVIRARLIFQKALGTHIEIFCLEPVEPVRELNQAFQLTGPVTWKCLIGNAKRWKSGKLEKRVTISGSVVTLFAERRRDLGDKTFSVVFTWDPYGIPFGEVLEEVGRTPLPPYITREDDVSDILRYQTIYAENEGSVAAPTAGLHFTEAILNQLRIRNVTLEKITLHIGLGTFRPVSAPELSRHVMHEEKIIVKADTIRQLLQHLSKPVIAVGTTSVRTLESLYWLGIKLTHFTECDMFNIDQWEHYCQPVEELMPAADALNGLLAMMEKKGQSEIVANTSLLIVPGYKFRIVTGMVTNFHQPRSTLLLLIAAFLGSTWKEAYSYAISRNFRFLSYGDSCLFINDQWPKMILF